METNYVFHPLFFPASIHNDVHEYIVTPANCPNTFPSPDKLNSDLMGWQLYNSGNITASMDAISMQVIIHLILLKPHSSSFPALGGRS